MPHFRVKSLATGQTTKVQADGTLANLHEAIRGATGATEVRVSLNRKTQLTGEGETLHELGLRSGDLIYLLDDGNGSPAAEEGAPAQPSSQPVAAPPAPSLAASGVPATRGGAGASSAVPGTPHAAAASIANTAAHKRAFADMLGRAGIVVAAVRPANALEFLTTLLHAAMLEAGFVARGADESGMPAGWKQAAGFFALEYTHRRYTAAAYADMPAPPTSPPIAQLKAFGMGEQTAAGPSLLVAHAVLAHAGDSPLFNCQLRAKDLLAPGALSGQADWSSLSSLAAPDRFVREVNVQLVQPLLAQLRCTCEKPLLVALCGEVRVQTLRHLDGASLARVGAVCRELREAARDDELWRELCRSELGKSVDGPAPPGGWRRAYTHSVLQQRERERERQHMEEQMRAEAARMRFPYGPARPHPMGPGGPMPQPGFPGMIGGDYDRMPVLPGGLLPGGMGGGLLGPPRGDPYPAGPFGDPDGRLPFGAVPPGSRYDPIHPDVDFDGGFGGGGGPPIPGRGPFRGPNAMRGRGRGLHPDLPDPSRFDFG